MTMSHGVSHRREEESLDAKIAEALAKTPEERYFEMLDLFDLYAAANPRLREVDVTDEGGPRRSIQIVELPRR